jgi:hypothetical protein
MRISRLFKRLRRWSSQAFRNRRSPAAFGTCRNAGNSVLTAEGTASKGTGSISCEVEFCIFYRLSQNFTDKGCTLRLCNTHCFSTATMVARTRLNVTLYVHCLSSFISAGNNNLRTAPTGFRFLARLKDFPLIQNFQ